MGGNAFKTDRIPIERLPILRSKVIKFLQKIILLPNIQVVGSGAKDPKDYPNSDVGDLDIAVAIPTDLEDDFLEDWIHDIQDKLESELIKIRYFSGLRIIAFTWLDMLQDEVNQYQIDLLFVPNLEFASWMHPCVDSKYKNSIRNELLMALAKCICFHVVEMYEDENGREIPIVYERLFLDWSRGLMWGRQSHKGKNGKPIKSKKTLFKEVTTDSVKDIQDMFYFPCDCDSAESIDDLSFESLLTHMLSDEFAWKSHLNWILRTAVKNMKRKKFEIPKELKKWE